MAEKLLMLALSPTMDKGTILRWLKREGDPVRSGDVLCEVETDKTTMEYESTSEGVLLKILAATGAVARVGETIAIVGAAGEDVSALLSPGAVPAVSPATAPAVPPAAETATPAAAPPASAAIAPATPGPEPRRLKVSPLARRLADEHDLDLRTVAGSGPGGRIVKRDVESLSKPAVPPVTSTPAVPSGPAILAAPAAPGTTLPVTGKRRIIAQRLVESKFSAPQFYLKVLVEMDTLLGARERLNTGRADKVSLNAFLLKFVAAALGRHPLVNASWGEEAITLHPAADLGLAVAQPDGLITPVVRNCGVKGIVAIHEELKQLIEKARQNRLSPGEYTGATFTVSNLGSYGIEEFTAIINPPGVAILAVGAIRRQPVVNADDTVRIASILRLTLSCDHRVVDGATGAAFLKDLQEMMEDPVRILF